MSRRRPRASPRAQHPAPRKAAGWSRLAPLVLAAAVAAAYHNSLAGPFLFDDDRILDNPHLRSLWPPGPIIVGTTRPFTDLSFAVNYAVGAWNVVGYHAVNLAVHVAAALVLLGLVHRTLLTPGLRAHRGPAAPGLALAIALIWAVHPLQTESVTYVVQRAESLMGLCYLLTFYCIVRGAASVNARRWYGGAIAACALGMASKPVMVTAPVLAWLYDRAFLARSWQEAWRERRGLHVGLAATWVIAGVIMSAPHESQATAGFAVEGLTPLAYARTQPGVVVHYLTLALWPRALVLDYDWRVARTANAILVPALLVATLGIATLWALRRRPALGFLGAWFFLILAPTSSFIPIADLAFEHRMYLPLAAVVALVVTTGEVLLRRLVAADRPRHLIASGILVGVVALLGILTARRNEDYQTRARMWADVVAKRPQNPRAHNNLGDALFREGKRAQAVPHYVEALRLAPDYAEAHNNLGVALAQEGRVAEAMDHYARAVLLKPDYAEAHSNLGNALSAEGRLPEAIDHFAEALRLRPGYAEVHNNLGLALAAQGKHAEAIAHYREALQLEPDLSQAHHNMGNSLFQEGALDRAVAEYTRALELNPGSAETRRNLDLAVQQMNRDRAR